MCMKLCLQSPGLCKITLVNKERYGAQETLVAAQRRVPKVSRTSQLSILCHGPGSSEFFGIANHLLSHCWTVHSHACVISSVGHSRRANSGVELSITTPARVFAFLTLRHFYKIAASNQVQFILHSSPVTLFDKDAFTSWDSERNLV